MNVFLETLRGVATVANFTVSPLYRYPYRNAAEAFRGDWNRIGGDISRAMESMKDDGRTEQE